MTKHMASNGKRIPSTFVTGDAAGHEAQRLVSYVVEDEPTLIPVRVGKGSTVHAMREGGSMTLCGIGQGMSNTRAGVPYRWHGDVTCKRCTRQTLDTHSQSA